MSKPIRILQVFARMNRGGAETMIMNLYRNIDRTKIQFDFLVHTQEHCEFDDEIVALGGCIHRIPRYSGKNHIQYTLAWNNFFKEHPNYKLIHGHIRSTASIYLKIAKKRGLITIAQSHSTSSGRGFSAIIKNVLQYSIKNRADFLFACSKSAGEWLFGKKACNNANFFIVNNAIDVRKFTFNKNIRDEKRKEFSIQNKFVIGHVGRFDSAKNQEFLIDIFKEVHDRNHNALLLLVGDGELIDTLKAKVENLGLTNDVIFTGVRSDSQEIFQAMDVFVFPSLYEGLGMVVVEAQATGLECIVSKAIPKEAFVTDLVESVSINCSIDIWAQAILRYATGYKRIDTYKEIKNKGYDIFDTVKWIETFYLESLRNKYIKSSI